MLELINSEKYITISRPAGKVIKYIREQKNAGRQLRVAEIGIGIGATTVEAMKLLDKNDSYYLFDFEDRTSELKRDLEQLDFCKAQIKEFGNSRKNYDSYSWNLAKLWQNSKEKDLFDVVYLDGLHSFFHDGLACCLLKKCCKSGAVIFFDDIDWAFSDSNAMSAFGFENFTEEQANAYQIAMVVDIFMKDDPQWELMEDFSTKHRVAFRRR